METTELNIVHGVKDSNAKWKHRTVSYITVGVVGRGFDRQRVEREIHRALADLEVIIANKESSPKGR